MTLGGWSWHEKFQREYPGSLQELIAEKLAMMIAENAGFIAEQMLNGTVTLSLVQSKMPLIGDVVFTLRYEAAAEEEGEDA